MLKTVMNLNLNLKVAMLAAVSVACTAAALVSVAVWQSSQYNKLAQSEVDKLINSDLDHITEGVYNLIRTENEAAQDKVNSNLNIARHTLTEAGGVELSRDTVFWSASNQFTAETQAIRLPRMLVGGRWLGKNHDPGTESAIVDSVARLVGDHAALFQRMNEHGDMLCVATTTRTGSGKRSIGTYIPAVTPDGKPNPVISTVIRDGTFHGRALVLNDWFLSAYAPIRDGAGTLVGMLAVGVRQAEIESRIRQALREIKLGKTGYVYILCGNGPCRGKYVVSQRGERDGENVWETRDSDGKFIIQEIVSKALSSKGGELSTLRYRWQNPGEKVPRWKVARLAYYAPLEWVIGTSVYEDELETYSEVLGGGRVRMIRIMSIAGMVATALFTVFGTGFALTIGRPVLELKRAVETIIDGDLNQKLDIQADDEIGALTRSFNIMTERLSRNHEEMKQMLDEIAESEGLLTMTEEISHLGSWSFDHKHNNLSWSDEVYRIFGVEPSGFAPSYDTFLDMVPEEDREMVDAAFSESLHADSDGYEIEHRIVRRATGEIRIVHEKCKHFRSQDGQIVRSVGMVQDITDRKRVEEALEKRIVALTQPFEAPDFSIAFEDLFNLKDIQSLQDEFANATGVASVITLPDGTPITAPSNFCRLCNEIIRKTEKGLANCYRSDAALGRLAANGPAIQPCMSGGLWDAGAGISVGGKHIANWLIGQVRDETQTEENMRIYAREIGADEQVLVEAFREVPSMSREKFRQVAKALYILANQLSATAYQNIQQARFITERKEMENALHLLTSKLEERVRLRTAELERLNKELEGFCYSISHELRAPLARLEGFSSLIREVVDEGDPSAVVHCADRIGVASIRLKTVIDSLLTLNRLSRSDVSVTSVDLSDMCRRIVEELRGTLGQRRIDFRIAEGMVVNGDSDMLETCMRNLISNAAKYTSRRSDAIVEVGTICLNNEDVYYIKDNGVGFDGKHASNLFVPFCRLHSESEFEGTGIGLATVHRIVEKHGGKIWADASPDRGATFYFTLGGETKEEM